MKSKLCLAIAGLLASVPVFAQMTITKGSSQVNSDGSFQYVAPIPMPVGRGGLVPNLSLVYNSNWGNGDLGLGWALNGISMITRCPRTVAQDGYVDNVKFTSSDAYCLDGHRLIPIKGINGESGTEYRTEIDAIESITSNGSYSGANSNGGPAYFIAKTKSGLRISYGGGLSNQADVLTMGNATPGPDNPIRGWAVSYIADRFDNNITFYYTNQSVANQGKTTPVDDGVFYPTMITYNDGKAIVQLNYNVRSEPPVRYADGYALPHSDKLLTNLHVFTVDSNGITNTFGDSWLYSFDSAARNGLPIRVNTINSCGASSCNYSTHMKYEDETTQSFAFSNSPVVFSGSRLDYDEYFVDLNGDGKKSWIRISQGADEAWIGTAANDGGLSSDRWINISQPSILGSSYAHFFADIDGDGKADWIRISRTTSDAWYALGNGGGSFKPWVKVNAAVGPANSTKHYFLDVNGDGRADWIQNSPSTVANNWTTSVALATGGGNFQFWSFTDDTVYPYSYFVDFNGDGLIDRILMQSNVPGDWNMFRGYFGQSDGTFKAASPYAARDINSDYQSSMGQPLDTQFADINGDGKIDLIQIFSGAIFVGYGKGNGTFDVARRVGVAMDGGINLFGDIDGDGLVDRIAASPGAPTGSSIVIYPSTGSSDPSTYHNVNFTLSPPNASSGNNKLYLADLNGDGKADLIMVSVTTGKAWVAMSQAAFSGKMNSIGLSDSVVELPQTHSQIQYKPTSDSSVYTSDTGAVYPLRDAIFPQKYRPKVPMLVSSITSPNGIGGTLTTNYAYAGAKTDLRDRGFLGMRMRTSSQVESGITTTETYRQDFPYTGLTASTKTTIASGGNGGLLSQTDFTYGCTNFVDGGCTVAPGNRYFPYLATATTSKWDLNGAPFPTSTINYQYDGFGNVTRTIKSTSDGFTEQIDTVYSNDATKWWIGQPTRITVTKTSP